MPKNEIKFEQVKDQEFTTIDNRLFKIGDYFDPEDFGKNERQEVFIKHGPLLRVLKKLFNIVHYEAKITNPPQKTNDWSATVSVSYVISSRDILNKEHHAYRWTSVAECNKHNAMKQFDLYPVTLAETRASARALRFILGIDLCSLEEVSDDVGELEDNSPIQDNQKNLLERKFMGEQGFTIEDMKGILKKEKLDSLDELSFTEAAVLCEKLNKKKPKNLKEVKED
jgi:hypothetical protein